MRRYNIRSTWENSVTVEVADDVELTDNIQDWPDEVADQVTSQTADLVDWEVHIQPHQKGDD